MRLLNDPVHDKTDHSAHSGANCHRGDEQPGRYLHASREWGAIQSPSPLSLEVTALHTRIPNVKTVMTALNKQASSSSQMMSEPSQEHTGVVSRGSHSANNLAISSPVEVLQASWLSYANGIM